MTLRVFERKTNVGVSPLPLLSAQGLVEMADFLGRVVRAGVLGVAAVFSMPFAARAQNPLMLPGKNYRVEFENSDVAVIRAHYGPHEKIQVHDHTSFSTVFVYLSDSGPVRINHEEEVSKEAPVTRPPTVKGAYRVAPGIAERHSIENLGDLSSDFLRVELKRISLQMKEPFRGKAPVSLSADSDGIEFSDPEVQIERIVCAGPPACAVKPVEGPSLLIAFTGFELSSGKARSKEMVEAGAVRWVPGGEGADVKRQGLGRRICCGLFWWGVRGSVAAV